MSMFDPRHNRFAVPAERPLTNGAPVAAMAMTAGSSALFALQLASTTDDVNVQRAACMGQVSGLPGRRSSRALWVFDASVAGVTGRAARHVLPAQSKLCADRHWPTVLGIRVQQPRIRLGITHPCRSAHTLTPSFVCW